MLKDAVVMSPVYPSLLFANVPMVAMIFVLLQSGSRDCGLDGGAGDGMRSARSPNISSITVHYQRSHHCGNDAGKQTRDRKWQTSHTRKDDRWHHASPQRQGRNRLSQNGEPSWPRPRGLNSD